MIPASSSQGFAALMRAVEKADGECQKHGKFSAFRRGDAQAECPRCAEDRILEFEADLAKSRRIAHLRSVSGIPDRYASAGLREYRQDCAGQTRMVQEAMRFTRGVMADKDAWRALSLVGNTGTGKTHVACAIAHNLIANGISVKYATALDMIADIRRAYSEDGKTEAWQIALYAKSFNVLVLDEADVIRTKSDSDLTLVSTVINTRYAEQRPVIIVSNQDFNGLKAILGQRITSRLSENGVAVTCDWEDNRSKGEV